jgi:hypothetical protein
MPRAASPPYGKYAWDGAVIFEVSGLVFNRRQCAGLLAFRLKSCDSDFGRLQANCGEGAATDGECDTRTAAASGHSWVFSAARLLLAERRRAMTGERDTRSSVRRQLGVYSAAGLLTTVKGLNHAAEPCC